MLLHRKSCHRGVIQLLLEASLVRLLHDFDGRIDRKDAQLSLLGRCLVEGLRGSVLVCAHGVPIPGSLALQLVQPALEVILSGVGFLWGLHLCSDIGSHLSHN